MQGIGRKGILIVPAIATLAFFFLKRSRRRSHGRFGGADRRGGDDPNLHSVLQRMLKRNRVEGLWQPPACTA
jgi:hypothetical protein